MKLLGYTFSDGSVLCARHATDTRDPDNSTGQAGAIFSTDEAHSHVVCDVEGCGIILEKNCTDGCGTDGYDHHLYYDDHHSAQLALVYVQAQFDKDAEMTKSFDGYSCIIAFMTSQEFSEEQVKQLVTTLSPDEYDLNISGGDDDEDLLDDDADDEDFPDVFTEHERSVALSLAEDELTIEYIERLERVAVAASAYHAKSLSNNCHGEPKLAHALYEALASVNFMQP